MSSRVRFERAITLQKLEGKLSRKTETKTGQNTKPLEIKHLNEK